MKSAFYSIIIVTNLQEKWFRHSRLRKINDFIRPMLIDQYLSFQ
jgi:hypothetical protein